MRRITFLMSLAFLLMLPWTSSATLVKSFSMTDLARSSDAIVRGHVVAIETVLDGPSGHVYTHTQIAVTHDLTTRRPSKRTFTLRQLGGVAGTVETRLVGNAQLVLGEEVVLFTRRDAHFHYLVGLSQGKYSVVRSAKGPATLRRTLNGAVPVAGGKAASPPAPNLLALAECEMLVRAARAPEVK